MKKKRLDRDVYCRSPGLTVAPTEKYLAGRLQSGFVASLSGVQYKMGISAFSISFRNWAGTLLPRNSSVMKYENW